MPTLKSIRILALLLALPLATTACVTTKVNGYTDNAYRGYKVKKVAVRAANTDFAFAELIENAMVEALKDEGIQAESFLAKFPPTRELTNAEAAHALANAGFDAIMYVNLVGSDSSAQTIGYIHTGNASVYGGSAYYSGNSLAMTAFHRYTSTRATLYEVVSGRKVWIADSRTTAGGLAYMGDDTQTESIAEETVASLQKSGHI